jgi:hypothetical protein
VYAPTLTGIGARKHLLSREIDLNTHIQLASLAPCSRPSVPSR